MVNPRFLYAYASEEATASATASASGYAPSNAVAIERATGWKGVGTGAQRLILNTTAAITPSGLGICGGNYSGWGTVKLQHSTDGVSWTDFLTLASLPSTDSTQDYFATLTAAPSKSWWALYWAAPSAVPELALFYLGTLATLSDQYDFPFDESDVYGVDVQVSEGRILNAEQMARRVVRFQLDFNPGNSTAAGEARAILQSEGGPLRPFFFVPIDESGSSTAGRAYLVRYTLGVFTLRRIYSNPYAWALPLQEEV